MDEEKLIHFRFTAIHILSKKLEPLTKEGIPQEFTFQIKTEVKVQEQINVVIPHVMIQIMNDKTQKELAEFTVGCFFEIEDFNNAIIKNEEGVYIIPQSLLGIILPVSISTVRGIIYSELRGTYLQNAIMPVVFVNEMKPDPSATT